MYIEFATASTIKLWSDNEVTKPMCIQMVKLQKNILSSVVLIIWASLQWLILSN